MAHTHTPSPSPGAYRLAPILPLATLLFAARGDLWQTNMSGISAEQGLRLPLLCWGAAAALILFFRMGRLMDRAPLPPGAPGRMLFAGCLLLMLGTAVPYGGDTPPALSAWHVALSMGGSLLGAAALGLFTAALAPTHPRIFRRAAGLYTLLALAAAVLFLAGRVTGLLEVYAVCAVCLYMERLDRWLAAPECQ